MSGKDELSNGKGWFRNRKGPSPKKRSPSPIAERPRHAPVGRVRSATDFGTTGSPGGLDLGATKGSPGRLDVDGGLRFMRGHSKTVGSTPDDQPAPPLKSPPLKPPNFFDFDENREDIFVESPEALVKKMRDDAKKRVKQEAKPYAPDEKVETIGEAYVAEIEERAISTMKKKAAGSDTPPSHQFSSPAASKPLPNRDSPISTRDLIRRDDKIASLERQLEDLKVSRWKPPPMYETINRILLGQSYSLDWYKTLEEKVALLDAAIATNDGNCIIAILLFIRRTLDHHILVGVLLKKPVAGRHYCSFLKQLQAWSELSSIYRTLSDYKSYGYLRLQQCEQADDPAARVKQLRACYVTFTSTPELKADAQYVDEYIKLTEKQLRIEEQDVRGSANIGRAGNIIFTPLTTTLLYCCRFHSNEPDVYSHPGSPEGLKRVFSISEKQFFQVSLVALSLAQDWKGVDELVTAKGMFGGRRRRSPIGFERVVRTISAKKHRAPDKVITKYLNEIEDPEQRLGLATEAGVFDVGIEALKLLRDKERLVSYINFIPVQRHREFRSKIQTILSNTQIRWK